MNVTRAVPTIGFLLLTGCSVPSQSVISPRETGPHVTAKVVSSRLERPVVCSDQFVPHGLRHTTVMHDNTSSVFDSNGSGLALGDLDGDGLTDIVLGNLNGPSQILWNQGHFQFKVQALETNLGLPESDVRAVQFVDVNADSKPDIVFTHTNGGIGWWRNDGERRFTAQSFDFTTTPAYTMLWDDLDGDGTLELVTASYDALLEAEQKNSFLFSSGGGTVVYHNTGTTMRATKLSTKSQTLALAAIDLNGDGKRELLIGNDFAVPDEIWASTATGWQQITPFARITKNTMGFTIGDPNNDGQLEVFASDMKPKFTDLGVIAKWMPFMQKNFEKSQYSSRQRAENVLQHRVGSAYKNIAYELGLDATGWTWSAQFGDLNNDGFEDLYAVNGMIDRVNLHYLADDELVETNQAFRNTGDGRFAPAPEWNLGSTASGRGMAMADLNNDGRLDIVVNNLQKPAQLFENQLCGNGAALEVALHWPSSRDTAALGATLRLVVNRAGKTLTLQRELRSQSGYLSGSDSRAHFGLAADMTPQRLEVLWPDGAVSSVPTLSSAALLEITRPGGQP